MRVGEQQYGWGRVVRGINLTGFVHGRVILFGTPRFSLSSAAVPRG